MESPALSFSSACCAHCWLQHWRPRPTAVPQHCCYHQRQLRSHVHWRLAPGRCSQKHVAQPQLRPCRANSGTRWRVDREGGRREVSMTSCSTCASSTSPTLMSNQQQAMLWSSNCELGRLSPRSTPRSWPSQGATDFQVYMRCVTWLLGQVQMSQKKMSSQSSDGHGQRPLQTMRGAPLPPRPSTLEFARRCWFVRMSWTMLRPMSGA